jgi:autotransporter adhesin
VQSVASGDFGAAFGRMARATDDAAVALGAQTQASGYASTAVGTLATASGASSVALGYQSVAGEDNTVSVGNADNQRRIVNVAAGTAATDAVNLSQLQAAITTANAYTDTAIATGGTAANAYTDDREAAIRADMGSADEAMLAEANAHADAGDAATLSASKAYADNKFAGWNDQFVQFQQQVDVRFAKTEARIDRSGAMQTAMAQMTASAAGTRTVNRVAVGVGAQNGKAALSVGYQRAIGDRAALTIGGAFSGGERSAGFGYGIGW